MSDEHGECRYEIERLNAELAAAMEIIAGLVRSQSPLQMTGDEYNAAWKRASDWLSRNKEQFEGKSSIR